MIDPKDDVPRTAQEWAFFMKFRYGTADPWKLVEILDIDLMWSNALGKDKLGRTGFLPDDKPFIILSSAIRDSPLRTRVLAHELGHAVMQNGVAAYYRTADHGYSKSEQQAESFCLTLLTELYNEETGHLPETIGDLQTMYGI
ncbi:ImmA/IrrE family metallo-endopeptidase [Lacticaseibacillus pabuli]|uniref:ImmA/IrrE family metallo-endopeptidase n=1 Tax=Lacticaseibacillus pabuli TaxID=3025672 RepID=A0ABY7WTS7_9LACO|nr:ImmA/IrrE family metallo-endopeptidase [Lacticaseibacillus sp. KACC 23028]WDF83563.1 ImmA/IrrE family metallo-endopeptidase [Lacticaseibacillus sp. KACC 23028]